MRGYVTPTSELKIRVLDRPYRHHRMRTFFIRSFTDASDPTLLASHTQYIIVDILLMVYSN